MSDSTHILGVSCDYHDAAACLTRDGKIVAAAQEERFTRRKHDAALPLNAIRYCLSEGGISPEDLKVVAFYEKPLLKFERLLETYLAYAPLGLASFLKAMPVWLKQKLWIGARIADELKYDGPILYPEHHLSHAASAFYPSPFERAAILTMDGVGEWTTTSWGLGDGRNIDLRGDIHFPHSLGLLYSTFTTYIGFKVNSGEYKLMGLAPYGEPRYTDLIRDHLIDVKPDGSFRLNMAYFNYAAGLTMTNRKFHRLFGGPPRKPESPLAQRDMDLAASIQLVLEEVTTKLVRHVVAETGERNLVMAGGVALNCVSNGRLLRDGLVDNLWIQPAAGDAGGAVGAALATWHLQLQQERHLPAGADAQEGSYLGPQWTREEIREYLFQENIPHEETQSPARTAAELIAEEKVVGWYQGRSEFGPRALGNRSILGDPRSPKMQSVMNMKIKYRESFRPFAPAVLQEDTGNWFAEGWPSPYMLLVEKVHSGQLVEFEDDHMTGLDKLGVARSTVPAVTHVDQTARVQTVSRSTNPLFHALITEFKEITGCPLVVNTSFNVRGEPIVNSPEDAYRCFMRTEMDALIMGNVLLLKEEQPGDTVAKMKGGSVELD